MFWLRQVSSYGNEICPLGQTKALLTSVAAVIEMEALVAAARQTGELPSLLLFLYSRQAQDHGPKTASRLQTAAHQLHQYSCIGSDSPFSNYRGFPTMMAILPTNRLSVTAKGPQIQCFENELITYQIRCRMRSFLVW